MKRILLFTLAILLLCAAFGCKANDPTSRVDDGRARPSVCGNLKVENGKLCDANGDPVMLRGVSTNELLVAESFLNEPLFAELNSKGEQV